MRLSTRASRQIGGVIAACALLAGCSEPSPAAPTPSPSPVSSTPIETQLEKQTRLDFEAAEAAYRNFRAEYTRLAKAGGTEKVTPIMAANAAGPYLKVMRYFLSETKAAGKRQQGEVRITDLTRGPYSRNLLTLTVCEDGTRVKNVSKSQPVSKGVAAELSIYVKRIDGRWKLWNGDEKRVDTCGK